ncbi:MAG: PLP-dependent lyase/thiolase [Patescibacteria group bacterium]
MARKTKIGATPLVRLESNGFDGLQAYLKDESANPSGTIKDRRSEHIFQEGTRLGVDKFTLISAGNNAFSLSNSANGEIKVVAIIDRGLPQDIKELLTQQLHQVIQINLQHKILRPEEVIAFAREREDEVIWDVTNGYEESYGSMVAELRELNPDYIVVPIGSGGIYVGVVQAIQRYRMSTKVIGIGVQNTMRSAADKLYTPWTPYAKVMAKFDKLGHKIFRLTEEEIKSTWQTHQHLADLEPSSAVVFAAVKKMTFAPTDTVVFVNSGKIKAP